MARSGGDEVRRTGSGPPSRRDESGGRTVSARPCVRDARVRRSDTRVRYVGDGCVISSERGRMCLAPRSARTNTNHAR